MKARVAHKHYMSTSRFVNALIFRAYASFSQTLLVYVDKHYATGY